MAIPIRMVIPPAPSSVNGIVVDAAGEWINVGFQAPKTGTIDRIVFTCDAAGVTGTAPTYRFGIENIGTTYAHGDGTYKSSGNAYVDQQPANSTVHTLTLGSSVSVTSGDFLAATMRYQSGTINASNYVRCLQLVYNPYTTVNRCWPYVVLFSDSLSPPTSIATYQQPAINFGVLYSDDTPAFFHTRIFSAINSATLLDGGEAGNQFRLSKPATMVAASYSIRQNAMGTGDTTTLSLWDDTGVALWSETYDFQELPAVAQGHNWFTLPSAINISPFRWYRLTQRISGYSAPQNTRCTFASGGINASFGTFPNQRFWDARETTRTYNAVWNEADWSQTSDVLRSGFPVFSHIGENLTLTKPRRVV